MLKSTPEEYGKDSSLTSSSASPGTHEDLASWKASPPRGEMATLNCAPRRIQPRSASPAGSRMSATVFTHISEHGEGLNGDVQVVVPSSRNHLNSVPSAPTDLEDIE